MKRFTSSCLIGLCLAAAAHASPVILIVRHAEKATTGGNDPDLSLAGQKRADALARILRDSQITAVFVTEFKRTQETAAPTAKATHLSPTVVPTNDLPGLVLKLRALNGMMWVGCMMQNERCMIILLLLSKSLKVSPKWASNRQEEHCYLVPPAAARP